MIIFSKRCKTLLHECGGKLYNRDLGVMSEYESSMVKSINQSKKEYDEWVMDTYNPAHFHSNKPHEMKNFA